MLLGELIGTGHYHQAPGRQPTGRAVPEGIFQFELVTDGHGWVLDNDDWVELYPGALMWHQPGDHTIGRSDWDDPYCCLTVRVEALDPIRRPASVPHVTWWLDLDRVRHFTAEVVKLFARGQLERPVLRDYIVSRLRLQAELYVREASKHMLPVELQRVLAYLDKHYDEPLRLETLADVAQWSVPHLHARFREELGQSPHQRLIERRIEGARVRLAGTNDPIKQVAADCGFSNASALCTLFRRAVGCTPAEYRRRQVRG